MPNGKGRGKGKSHSAGQGDGLAYFNCTGNARRFGVSDIERGHSEAQVDRQYMTGLTLGADLCDRIVATNLPRDRDCFAQIPFIARQGAHSNESGLPQSRERAAADV